MKKSAVITLVVAAATALTGCGGSEDGSVEAGAASSVEQVDPETTMFEACRDELVKYLKSPATAQFPDPSTAEYRVPDPSGYGQTRVFSYLDSENGFGALIRSEWSCSVRLSSDNGSVTKLGRIAIEGNPVGQW